MQSKQGDVNNAVSIYTAAKKAISPNSIQVSSLFQDSKGLSVVPTGDNKENIPWSSAQSEQASSAKMSSPSIATLASRALSMDPLVTKGIFPLPSKYAVTNVTSSSSCQSQLVSTGGSVTTASDGLITITPLYTTLDGRNVIVHKSLSSTPTLQAPIINSTTAITSMAASLLSAACKPLATNIPTVGQLLQSNQWLACSQKTEQSTTTI